VDHIKKIYIPMFEKTISDPNSDNLKLYLTIFNVLNEWI